MSAEAIMAVSVAVVALVQLIKWAGLPDKTGPIAVLVLSLLGVLFFVWAEGPFTRSSAFGYFAAWITVATSAAGTFGFTRAGSEAVTRLTSPPESGAGSNVTVKD